LEAGKQHYSIQASNRYRLLFLDFSDEVAFTIDCAGLLKSRHNLLDFYNGMNYTVIQCNAIERLTMNTVQKSLRLPRETAFEIEKMAQETGRDFSSVTKDLLAESIKIRRCPGIVFAEGVSGRRAKIAGSGLDVWEVIATYRSVDEDFKRLAEAYHWLRQPQLRSALGYYSIYKKEIDKLIIHNNSWTVESVAQRHPHLKGEGM